MRYVGRLVTKTERDILRISNDRSFLNEVNAVLAELYLALGMNFDWPNRRIRYRNLKSDLWICHNITAVFCNKKYSSERNEPFKADRCIYKFSGFAVCLGLLIPFFVFLLHVKRLSLPEGVSVLCFWMDFFQAFLASLISLFFGLLGSQGILYFNAKYRSLIKACCLIPAFIPSLLFCVSLVNLTEQFLPFSVWAAGFDFCSKPCINWFQCLYIFRYFGKRGFGTQ